MYYILKAWGPIKHFAVNRCEESTAVTANRKRIRTKRKLVVFGPTDSLIFYKITGVCAWCVLVLTDPFKDPAAAWLVPSASSVYGHLNSLGIGTLVLDIRNHRLV